MAREEHRTEEVDVPSRVPMLLSLMVFIIIALLATNQHP